MYNTYVFRFIFSNNIIIFWNRFLFASLLLANGMTLWRDCSWKSMCTLSLWYSLRNRFYNKNFTRYVINSFQSCYRPNRPNRKNPRKSECNFNPASPSNKPGSSPYSYFINEIEFDSALSRLDNTGRDINVEIESPYCGIIASSVCVCVCVCAPERN